jgi:hypothetical protein
MHFIQVVKWRTSEFIKRFPMKLTFALIIFAFALTSQAESVENSVAKLQLQRLLFGNETTKTERASLPGQQANGESCTIELRKTRFGVYLAITTPDRTRTLETGVTNSHFTTQNLDFTIDESTSTVKFSRMSVTGINERGEDYGNETATLVLDRTGDVAKVKSLDVSYEVVKLNYDAKYNPIYSSSGNVESSHCTAL